MFIYLALAHIQDHMGAPADGTESMVLRLPRAQRSSIAPALQDAGVIKRLMTLSCTSA